MTTWFRLPRIVRAAIIGVGWLGYLGLILRLLSSDSAARLALPVGLGCVLGSALTAVADHRVHGKFGSVDRMTEYRRALWAGTLPKGVDLDQWARWLSGSQTANGLAALCGFPVVMFGLFTSLGSDSPYRWLPVAMFTLILGIGAVLLVRRGVGIRALAAAVKRRRPPVSAAGTSRGASSTRASTMLMKDSVFEMSLAGRLVPGFVMWFAGAFVVLLIVDLGTLVFGGPWIMRLDLAAGLAALMGLAWVVSCSGTSLTPVCLETSLTPE
ncbi:hypothetical protein [Mycolicibacterium tusciae]|uniref:hypothetical protein n=1 Tax=Mycolicibacterium tusciae TaxID=75922 RepID=UPI00024A4C15|nr:hypothetical protein [Mycolicibacterium tusciae]